MLISAKNEICDSKWTGCNESFFLPLCSLCLSVLWQVLMPTRLFFACTKWWNCGWQTSFLETLDKFNLQKVCGEWQNWKWTQFFPKCLAFCVYSGFQEWSQNDQNEVAAERSIWSIPVEFAAYQLWGPCVRKLLTGLIMYIYPLKIKNIVLYCIVT